MLNFKHLIGMKLFKKVNLLKVILFLGFPFISNSQCLDTLNFEEIIQTENTKKILSLIERTKVCPKLKDSLAYSYHKLGTFFYFENNLDSAIIFTERALKIRKKLNEVNSKIDLGKTYNNLGVFYRKKNNFKLAIDRLQQAINVFKDIDSVRMLNSYVELAISYEGNGNLKQAKEICDLIIIEANKINSIEEKGKALVNYSKILNKQKDYSKSIKLSKRALDIYRSIKDLDNQAICHINLGLSYYKLGNYSDAIQNYLQTIKIYNYFGMTEELAIAQNNLAVSYQKNNQKQKSFKILNKALNNAQEINSKEIITQSYNNLGEYYISINDYSTALSNFQNSIKTLLPEFEPANDFINPLKRDVLLSINRVDLLTCLGDKAKTLHLISQSKKDPKYLSAALELYELGDVVIDQLRQDHQDQKTKLFWRKEAIPFYEKAIELCYEMQDVEKAFFFFEKSKAILLLESLQTSDALALVPDSLKNQLLFLQKDQLKTKELLENTAANDVSREKIIKELLGIQSAIEFEIEKLGKKYPKFYEVKFGTKVLSLEEAKSEKTALHFFYGEKNIYAITINSHNTNFYKLGSTESIEKEIRSLLSFFEKSSSIENAPQDFLQQSKKIYDILIAPLSFEKGEELIIFPDGALAYLPFEALVKDASNEIATANYLIKNHLIQYGYSATIFSKLNKKAEQSTENSIFAFAPFADGSSHESYAPLTYSQDELGAISQQIEGVFLKNKEATKQRFLEEKNNYSVLHLSTHAFSSATENKPHIVFADTLLFLSELYGLDIQADLVVLSACQSNIGKLSPGEGVMSLGRGFSFAGAKSLVSSLWNVNAGSTSSILSNFYHKLQNKTNKYESLHHAKIAYLKNENIPSYEKSPYYWAGLVYYGDHGNIMLQKKSDKKFYFLLFFGILCFVIGWFISKRK